MGIRRLEGGWGIALGLAGACTIPNAAYESGAVPTEGSASMGDPTVADGTVTTGGPADGTVSGGPVDGDGTIDSGEDPQSCQDDRDCADDEYCNGPELCDPGGPGTDDRGCRPGNGDPCLSGTHCNEDENRCVTDCEQGSDADGDMVDSIDCQGLDCDDSNDQIYPGADEICDEVDNDCDPTTYGSSELDGDADGDGSVSHECCNPDEGMIKCGPDCDDSQPGIVYPGDWAHCAVCNDQCDVLQACEGGSCIPARRVFVTSTQQMGDMGGLEGADDICQTRADSMDLGGQFRAYLIDGNTGLEARLEPSTEAYIRLDGVRVADNWGDLTDGMLQAAINVDEQRLRHDDGFERAWTGLTGEPVFDGDCGNWTDVLGMCPGDGCGASGDVAQSGPTWEANGYQQPCSFNLRLYCIEQDPSG